MTALAQNTIDQTETPHLRFAGQIFEPLPSGALYWHARETLLVADLHFAKMASFARQGQLLPPYDTGLTLSRLEADLRRTGARTLLALGDSFHRADASSLLTPADRSRLDRMTDGTACIWLAGNHDPGPTDLGGDCRTEITLDGITFAHEPRRSDSPIVSGHLHPAARIMMAGRSTRRACFVHDNRQLILPAYGSSTGNINILGPAFHGLLHFPSLEVVMLGKDRTYPVSPKRLIGG